MADQPTAKLILTGPDLSEVVAIGFGRYTLGRQSGNEVPLPSPLVSREHARIVCDETGCQIVDLGSSNGTLLNHDLLTPNVSVLLQHGDLVEIGPYQLRFELAEMPAQDEEPVAAEVTAGAPAPAPPLAAADQAPVPAGAPPPSPATETQTRLPAGVLPPPPPIPILEPAADDDSLPPIPPGLDRYSRRLLEYLPPIYHSDFMSRFMALFEAILMPMEWTVDNFDLYMDPRTSPNDFLPWLANWFVIMFDDSWSEAKRRTFLQEAHQIYARRGTRWALARTLAIYTGREPEIDDEAPNLEPLTFSVRLPVAEETFKRDIVENIIDTHKPAHTTYVLTFAG